ncbi:MAG: exopolysaccharide Pel transporter PelG [Clostridium sp.]|jgi:uncharacterized membrane protein|nr:exopolysaccharide Pel transporter PelG [Clostridium sp.]
MAGIGVSLYKLFRKNTLLFSLVGSCYSTVITIAPMVLVIGTLLLMERFLGFYQISYAKQELFSCLILYIFIFAQLVAAPFNAVLSKYLADVLYVERYEDVAPCFSIGLFLNVFLGVLIGAPFCAYVYLVGRVELGFVCIGFCGYVALVMAFYGSVYLNAWKGYRRIALYFLLGMLFAFLLAAVLALAADIPVTYALLIGLALGFLLIACLEFATVRNYFTENSNRYRPVLVYFKKYWKLAATNFFYVLGMYIHNFVYWQSELRVTVAKSFLTAPPYDMAAFLAVLTNLSANVIFVTRVEMHFHGKYKAYAEAIVDGRGIDIERAKVRMFQQLSEELMTLVRVQFLISIALYLVCVLALPRIGFSGLVMKIYPCMAAGYFILFVMYSAILFLGYYQDHAGSLLAVACFCTVTLAASRFAGGLPEIWYGLGIVLGSLAGWVAAYSRLRWIEKHIDRHMFCQGQLLKRGRGRKPSQRVYRKKAGTVKG